MASAISNEPALRTYYDPSLWDRLVPAVREEIASKTRHLVDGRWKTLEEAREQIGYLRALHWLFDAANDLTRIEDDERETPGA